MNLSGIKKRELPEGRSLIVDACSANRKLGGNGVVETVA